VRAPGLSVLAALAARAALFVGPDSGPRHIARAVGTPAVVLYGPTDPRHTAWHLEHTRHVRHAVACGPCHRERCPLAGPGRHACMTGIDADEIVAAARGLTG
jgi:ADP-heptose:LPS heptosyltransferase